MSDFEICPRGTLEENRLGRELVLAIQTEIESWGDVVPHSVRQAYNRLQGCYMKQWQREEYDQGHDQKTSRSDY